SYWAVLCVQVGFQIGFCVFVLANYMRTLPPEIMEAAVVDGAGVWTRYWRVTLPLCRPALAALGTLQFTWMYNDFLWALVFISDGDKLPTVARELRDVTCRCRPSCRHRRPRPRPRGSGRACRGSRSRRSRPGPWRPHRARPRRSPPACHRPACGSARCAADRPCPGAGRRTRRTWWS
ncbi:Transport systems inner membrane protein, partial [Streptomyces clavuligerus]